MLGEPLWTKVTTEYSKFLDSGSGSFALIQAGQFGWPKRILKFRRDQRETLRQLRRSMHRVEIPHLQIVVGQQLMLIGMVTLAERIQVDDHVFRYAQLLPFHVHSFMMNQLVTTHETRWAFAALELLVRFIVNLFMTLQIVFRRKRPWTLLANVWFDAFVDFQMLRQIRIA